MAKYFFFSANVNNIRNNTKGMHIHLDRLADAVTAIEEKQDGTAKTMELIHILVNFDCSIFRIIYLPFLIIILILFPIFSSYAE